MNLTELEQDDRLSCDECGTSRFYYQIFTFILY